MSHHDNHHEEANPPAILYIGVLLAAATILYLLINVAARPWGWPQGAVDQMHQAEGLTGEGHGAAAGHH